MTRRVLATSRHVKAACPSTPASCPGPAGLASGGGAGASALADLAVALNNTDVAADYAAKLRAELETHINGLLASASDREKWVPV